MEMSWRITTVANETEKDPRRLWCGCSPQARCVQRMAENRRVDDERGRVDSWRRDGSRKTLPASLQGLLGDDRDGLSLNPELSHSIP